MSVTLRDSIQLGGPAGEKTFTAPEGKAYLVVSVDSSMKPSMDLIHLWVQSSGSGEVYVTDSQGDKYSMGDAKLFGSTNILEMYFGPIPKDSKGFQLYYLDLPIVELGK